MAEGAEREPHRLLPRRPLPQRATALATLAVVLLALYLGRTSIERRLVSLLESALSRRIGAAVDVEEVGFQGLSLRARGVRVDDRERGLLVSIDRVTATPRVKALLFGGMPAFERLAIAGAEIVLDRTPFEASGPSAPAPAASDRPRKWRAPSLASLAKTAELDDVVVSLSRGGRKRELVRVRGSWWLDTELDERSVFRLSATLDGDGVIEGEGTLLRAGGADGTLRFRRMPLAAWLGFLPEIPWHEPQESRVDGTISFSAAGEAPVTLSGAVDLRDLGVAWDPVAERPVTGDVGIELRAFVENRALQVESGSLRSGAVTIAWDGTLGLDPSSPNLDLRMRLAETPCQNVIDGIPEGVLGELAAFRIDGKMSGRLRLTIEPERPDETRLDVEVDDRCVFRSAPPSADLARLRRPFLHRVSPAKGSTVFIETGPYSRNWTSLSSISPFLVHAFLAHEDATFFHHRGFAPDAFRVALERNLEEGRFASGASTISMQLARNLFLVRDKTLARKLREILLTWWLEKNLTKQEILELYVNLVELGPGVFGVGAASRYYFGRTPAELSPAEAAFLATLLPAPARYHRDYDRGELSPAARTRVERLLAHMARRGRIDDRALDHGLDQIRWLSFHYGAGPAPRRREVFGKAAPLPVPTAQASTGHTGHTGPTGIDAGSP